MLNSRGRCRVTTIKPMIMRPRNGWRELSVGVAYGEMHNHRCCVSTQAGRVPDMNTTAVAQERSNETLAPSWPSEMYDGLIREAIGDDALQHDRSLVGTLSGTDLLRAYTLARVSRTMD